MTANKRCKRLERLPIRPLPLLQLQEVLIFLAAPYCLRLRSRSRSFRLLPVVCFLRFSWLLRLLVPARTSPSVHAALIRG